MLPRTRMKDIAEIAGVSIACVSNVLNNKWREKRISEKTQKKVLKIAKKLKYSPNIAARELIQQKSSLIALLMTESMVNPFSVEIVCKIEENVRKRGYELLLCIGDETHKYTERLMSRNVAGVFLAPAFIYRCEDHPVASLLQDGGANFMVFGWCADERLNYVNLDYFKGGYLAAEHLLKSGHDKIGYLGGEPDTDVTHRSFYAGYRKALADYNLEYRQHWIKKSNVSYQESYDAMNEFLNQKELPSAIVAHNDIVAIGALKALEERGVSVPDDMSIVGCDNIEASSFARVPLTTVSAPKDEVYSAISNGLLDIIEGKYQKRQLYFEPKLVIRKS